MNCDYSDKSWAATTKYSKGCRCDECRSAAVKQSTENKWKREGRTGPKPKMTPIERLASKRLADSRARAKANGDYTPLTAPKIEVIFALQVRACECCGTKLLDFSDRCLDHCHETGALRGVLCNDCNRAEGLLKSDPEIVRSLLKYLEGGEG